MNSNVNLIKEILRIQEAGEKAALCTLTRVEGSVPQVAGAKMIVRVDGSVIGTVGGGNLEHKLREKALQVIADGKPVSVDLDLGEDLGMACGGDIQAFIEPIERIDRLVIFGGGHIAKPMASIAKLLGFRVAVIDDRYEWANRERFPEADEVIHEDFKQYVEKTHFQPNDYLLIVTRGHRHDQLVLEKVVRASTAWLGMIGSKKKVDLAFDELRKQGISEQAVERIESPVGFDIGAVSPEEIAISVAARLVQVRRFGPEAPTTISLIKTK